MYSLVIVEDDESIRDGLVHLFPWENTGFTVEANFSNGLSAWNYIQEHPSISALMTDVRMPIMDGLELTKRVYEAYPQIHVFLISGYQDFSYAQTAIHYNVEDFLIKPIRYQSLMLDFLKLKEELDKEAGTSIETFAVNQYYDAIIRNAKSYILEHLATVQLEDVASMSNLSCSYMSRLFKQYTSMQFSDYVMKKRMEKSCILLTNPKNKIYEIADAVGYDNPKNFSRAFKLYFGVSPKEYRENGGNIT